MIDMHSIYVTWKGQKILRHVAAYENVTCHTCVHMQVYMCARACACVCVINENKYPF